MRLALVTSVASYRTDEDLPLLCQACAAIGVEASVLSWDDPTVSWGRFDMVVLRSPWDYVKRLPEFMSWCTRVAATSQLVNPLPVLRWNTDKHYLAELAAMGVPVVPTEFVELGAEPLPALKEFLAEHRETPEHVVKPAVSAGSMDTQRYTRAQEFAAANHIARLLDEGRSVMLQPYFASVDEVGETALIFLGGKFSHAVRKAQILHSTDGAAITAGASESISPCEAAGDELALAKAVLDIVVRNHGLAVPLSYARVDVIRDGSGKPALLELELAEPSLFFRHRPDAAQEFAQLLLASYESHNEIGRPEPPDGNTQNKNS